MYAINSKARLKKIILRYFFITKKPVFSPKSKTDGDLRIRKRSSKNFFFVISFAVGKSIVSHKPKVIIFNNFTSMPNFMFVGSIEIHFQKCTQYSKNIRAYLKNEIFLSLFYWWKRVYLNVLYYRRSFTKSFATSCNLLPFEQVQDTSALNSPNWFPTLKFYSFRFLFIVA